jgi:glycosyltransferase involved in cell wall biosynthesis/SAM-dependent methyltransferase
MRLAFVSPLPPSKSGIADYSAALLPPLRDLAEVTTFADAAFDPAAYDLVVYQIGNNPHHGPAYELALQYPGVVVLHESNLHHLLAELTIRRGDWDGYLREVEYDGGPEALAYARRVRALEVGPDYEGVAMLRRILEGSRAVIVHSRYVAEQVRKAGFCGPIATIPHGAWIPMVDRERYRSRLGLDEMAPLLGVFGFLKPYKRIAEALRALKRLVRLEPRVKMILAGEPHPDLPLAALIRRLDLAASVRVLGFVPIEDFEGYMAACDIVLNLRYPTVGETSGSLLRALGLGKATLVSDVGAFRELPEDVCLKVPVDTTEEDVIFEYLNLLVSRPSVARGMGARAREWVERECNWPLVARRYVEFLSALLEGSKWEAERQVPQPVAPPPEVAAQEEPADSEEVLRWTPEDSEARSYVDTHLTRIEKTLAITPPGGAGDRILEMGAYLQMTPQLRFRLGYPEVRGCYFGPLGKVEHKTVRAEDGEVFECDIDLFDAEKDVFPYPDGHFTTVLCCELIEHLASDPVHMMAEINRILKPGGHLVLTTPNLASLRSLSALLLGYHPGLYSVYLRPSDDKAKDARHHREYTPLEIHLLLEDSGFEVSLLETGPFRDAPHPGLAWVVHLLERYQLSPALRGEGIYAVGRKQRPVKHRFPAWLYSGPDS